MPIQSPSGYRYIGLDLRQKLPNQSRSWRRFIYLKSHWDVPFDLCQIYQSISARSLQGVYYGRVSWQTYFPRTIPQFLGRRLLKQFENFANVCLSPSYFLFDIFQRAQDVAHISKVFLRARLGLTRAVAAEIIFHRKSKN